MRVTFCHCRFCQRARGGAYAVEPIFELSALKLLRGRPKTYEHRSTGSGKLVHVHFCERCGAGLYYTFERYDGVAGIHGGTFDDPEWFEGTAENTRHIFISQARQGTVIPAGVSVFEEHAIDETGQPLDAAVFSDHHLVDRRRSR